jgi:hypothetical protein
MSSFVTNMRAPYLTEPDTWLQRQPGPARVEVWRLENNLAGVSIVVDIRPGI